MPDIAAFATTDRNALVTKWKTLFSIDPPKSISRSLLHRILAFEIQASRLGGLDHITRKAIKAHQTHIDSSRASQAKSVKFKAGSRFMREWNGITHIVDVVENGYRWRGENYKFLSAIAKVITGVHWSGPRFFGQMQKRSPQ